MNDGRLLDVRIGTRSLEQLVSAAMAARTGRDQTFTFACANPHSLVVARRDAEFRRALDSASAVVADGVGCTLAARMAGISVGPRITGSDFFNRVMSALDATGGKVFFFGSSDEVLIKLTEKVRRNFPHVTVASLSPPFRQWSDGENATMIQRIQDFSPDVLWVGMTAPKQEKWVCANVATLQVPVVASIGAVFDYYAGVTQRAPKWICDLGLEWLYRLPPRAEALVAQNLGVSAEIFVACSQRADCEMKSLFARTNAVKSRLSDLLRVKERFARLDEQFDEVKINQGLILSAMNDRLYSKNLQDYEFKIFSQWGEDGIIQRLTKEVEIRNRTFIEFGVESFHEANCRFLLMKDNWRGFVIDGSIDNIRQLQNSHFFWKYPLSASAAFITKDNINDLLAKSGFDTDLGILSVDLDGNDYYVLEAVSAFKPRILICEYNAVFGRTRKISVPYDPSFVRTKKHPSNLYWGASLAAFCYLADKTGYALVGTNRVGSNAFFVRNELVTGNMTVLTAEEAYAPSTFREGRDSAGNLTYIDGEERLEAIKGMPVFNVETGAAETL